MLPYAGEFEEFVSAIAINAEALLRGYNTKITES
jgi:hypothetical protein